MIMCLVCVLGAKIQIIFEMHVQKLTFLVKKLCYEFLFI